MKQSTLAWIAALWMGAAGVSLASAQDVPPPAPPPPAPPPPPAAQQEPAVLTINTTPPTRVLLDGRLIGNTPLMGVRVPPGPHDVTLETLDGTHRETVSMMLAPGEQMRMVRHVGPGMQLGGQLSFSIQSGSGGSGGGRVVIPPPGLRVRPGIRIAPQINPAPPPGAQGAFVVLSASRPATISVDGRPIGRAPRRFFLSAGRHRVDVISTSGQRRKVVLVVRHGQPIRRHVRF